MLEKPNLPDEKFIACLRNEYGLRVAQIAFLPIGADLNTAVYRAVAEDDSPYFVKLRRGTFDEITVMLPKFLSDQGIAQIIAPLATTRGQLWANWGADKLMLYPFVDGRDGYAVDLSEHYWIDLGKALKRIHTMILPPALMNRIQRETYTPQWRESVKTFLARHDDASDDPVAVETSAYLKTKRNDILDLLERAERLAQALQVRASEFVLCHSDIHAGNILIDANDALYIVDWDDPILAPKERDLMFVGGGQGFTGHTAQEEETLFYQGYGQTQIDPIALAYYRYERIIEDIVVECEQIFSMKNGGADRAQALRWLTSNFAPNNAIEIAYQSDKTMRA
jgi:spectinomycin phosphotransferase